MATLSDVNALVTQRKVAAMWEQYKKTFAKTQLVIMVVTAVTYLGLGQAYNSLGRFKEALAPLARLDAILPGAWDAHCETAVAHLGMGESEAAVQDITRAERVRRVDRQSRSALSYLRAIARLQMNDYRRAKADLEEVIEQDPEGEFAMRSRQLLEQLSARLTDRR